MRPFPAYLLCLYLLALFSPVRLALVNVTVDDSGQDPITNRSIIYGLGYNAGQDCGDCLVTTMGGLDPGKTYMRSWHDSTYKGGPLPCMASFTFTGSAIYVFGILAGAGGPWSPSIDIQFYIDERLMSTFQRTLPTELTYNVPYFAIDNLTNSEHSLTILNGEVGKNQSLALIDYLVYSYDPNTNQTLTRTPTPTPAASKAPAPAGVIAAGVLGGVALILLFASIYLYLRSRQNIHAFIQSQPSPDDAAEVTPYSGPSNGPIQIIKNRLRGTQDVVQPPAYTEISAAGTASSPRALTRVSNVTST
ncbi:hypothetical protein P691DRAFT_805741 [Macrolepiota fuliginosa MF-IS2]|uniref:Uncharacterized protein n=1 Tax=Macrolepiota fuliginosa MF-IS2 TaxID=1400762 RepID=A0A9P5X6H1_9AGAR|nr:hypothetical protein P691DRAFT_805741 [Macrolepiota fuliginosa MF-IS2]